MSFGFSQPLWLLLLLCLPWVIWLSWKSPSGLDRWRRWFSLAARLLILTAVAFALAASATLGLPSAVSGQPSFRDRIAGDPEINSRLNTPALDRAFDLQYHLRFSGEIIDRALRDREN